MYYVLAPSVSDALRVLRVDHREVYDATRGGRHNIVIVTNDMRSLDKLRGRMWQEGDKEITIMGMRIEARTWDAYEHEMRYVKMKRTTNG
jgi:hypothetical protein